MIKFEITISAWEDGLHRGRKRLEIDENDILYLSNIEAAFDELTKQIKERREKWKKIMEGDDIPF